MLLEMDGETEQDDGNLNRAPRAVFIASYSIIAICTCVNLVLVAIAAKPVAPWIIGVGSLGAACATVVVVMERKLGIEPSRPHEDDTEYWSRRRRIAAVGGLGLLLALAVLVGIKPGTFVSNTAVACMLGVAMAMFYELRPPV